MIPHRYIHIFIYCNPKPSEIENVYFLLNIETEQTNKTDVTVPPNVNVARRKIIFKLPGAGFEPLG
jgi:hypothetical protein